MCKYSLGLEAMTSNSQRSNWIVVAILLLGSATSSAGVKHCDCTWSKIQGRVFDAYSRYLKGKLNGDIANDFALVSNKEKACILDSVINGQNFLNLDVAAEMVDVADSNFCLSDRSLRALISGDSCAREIGKLILKAKGRQPYVYTNACKVNRIKDTLLDVIEGAMYR